MSDFSEYTLEPLRESAGLVLYRGTRPGHSVLLLIPSAEYPPPGVLRALDNEFAFASALDSEWAARPLMLGRYRGRTALTLEDGGGTPLERLLGQRFDVPCFLQIAIGIAGTLVQVHRRALIHKDLNPANVLIDAAGRVKLTGFGIATRLPREHQAPDPPEVIAGTLPYMAPEQTGRVNRSIDTRSDLYACGVIFHQMLSGALPFTASDAMEWFHCHMARRPAPLGDVPEAISAIVAKLLSKSAEDRYQTAAGLEFDLRRCLAEPDAFPLGSRDVSDRLMISEQLYGREREIETLLSAFDRVLLDRTPQVVLVSGYSGIGKSSVVNELHKVLVPPRALFASGKFDQYKRDIPYAMLAQAMQGLIRQILAKSETEMGEWRSALREALDRNGQLMINLVPELEIIIGKQPPVPDLPPAEAQLRFQTVFRRFLGVFARPEHPLALFFDDLQWLDAATLVLFEHLATSPDVRHLLIVGAYRDNEITASHPLIRTLDAIRGAGVHMSELVLTPLRQEDITRLVADALRTEPMRAKGLANLLHEKSGGNPFFAIQFFAGLAEEQLVRFDEASLRWEWDVEQIRAKGFTDNVVELMLRKLVRLPPQTQEALKQFACLGNTARVETLGTAFGNERALGEALWEAVRTGLVLRTDRGYAFLHDRVQEAAYELLPQEARPAEHLRIGRELLAHVRAGHLEDEVFEIVNQLDRAQPLIVDPAERRRVAELNLIAGRRARTSSAHASARSYFAAGSTLLADDGWTLCRDLKFQLEHDLGASEFVTGDLVAADERLSALAGRTSTHLELAAVTWLRVTLYTAMDQSPRAVETGIAYLREIGIVWSPHPPTEEMQTEYQLLLRRVRGRSFEELVELPLMEDAGRRATVEVLMAVLPPAVYTDRNLVLLLLCRVANISIEHGNTDASCVGYAYLGMYLGPTFGDYEWAFKFANLGLDLVEKRGLDRFRARVFMTVGYHVGPWTRPVDPFTFTLLRRTFDAANEVGDVNYVAYYWYCLVASQLAHGTPLADVQREIEAGLAFVTRTRFGLLIDILSLQLSLVQMLRGLTPVFGRFDNAGFDESRYEAHLAENRALVSADSTYWIRKIQARFLAGDSSGAIAAAAVVEPRIATMYGHLELAEFYFYAALASASLGDAQAVAVYLKQLEVWAQTCPENWEDRAALVAAELARIERREWEAQVLYEKAIRSAREHGLIHQQGIAFERAAGFYASRGFETAAQAYLRNARSCYLQWGAEGKVQKLDDAHPELRLDATSSPSVAQLDLATVLKVSHAVTGEIVLDKLIQTLMAVALENAGAERALLMLKRGEEMRIEAEATTSPSSVEVQLRQAPAAFPAVPESILRYVIRTRTSVVLENAATHELFSNDDYFRQRRSRSVLCLPLVKQGRLVGALYLENNLVPNAFSPRRIAVLEVVAFQAALSLENALLYTGLQRSEAYLAEAQKLSLTGSFGWNVSSGEIFWSEETYRLMGFARELKPTLEEVLRRVHPEDLARLRETLETAARKREGLDYEHRLLMNDGSVKHVHVVAQPMVDETFALEYVGAIMDITQRKRAEEELRRSGDIRLEERVNERTRIARELHDTLLQSFQGLMLRFQTVDDLLPGHPLEAKQALEGALDRADRAIGEGRDAVKGLRSPKRVDADLETAIDALGKELDVESAAFQLHVSGTPRGLQPGVWEETYRIACEALHNAFTHARARRIETEIDYGEELFRLRIRDDGIGLDATVLNSGRPGHWGLLGMSERARRIGGEFDVRSRPGAGTEVELRMAASAAYETSFPAAERG